MLWCIPLASERRRAHKKKMSVTVHRFSLPLASNELSAILDSNLPEQASIGSPTSLFHVCQFGDIVKRCAREYSLGALELLPQVISNDEALQRQVALGISRLGPAVGFTVGHVQMTFVIW